MKTAAKVWVFASDSNPDKEYHTLQYTDGTVSCDCHGWTRRCAANGARNCKHTRYVDMGRAEHHAVDSHEYENENVTVQVTATVTVKRPVSGLGHRKFAI